MITGWVRKGRRGRERRESQRLNKAGVIGLISKAWKGFAASQPRLPIYS